MVAYSFKNFFVPQIVTGIKCQTVRADRKRHAQIGEAIQLYEGMRTKSCRKIIPDVLCAARKHIAIEWRSGSFVRVEIEGCSLDDNAIEIFARYDGFAPEHINGLALDLDGKTARLNMEMFWISNHPGTHVFEGVLLAWAKP